MYDIVVGRSKSDMEKYGTKGTILLGKHYVKMGQVTSMSNNILLAIRLFNFLRKPLINQELIV